MAITFSNSTIGASCTINRGVSRESTKGIKSLNSSLVRSVGGDSLSIAGGPNLIEGVLRIDFIDKTEADAFIDWISGKIRFYKYTFTITPDAYTDLGTGTKGGTLENVSFVGESPSTNSIITPMSEYNDRYSLTFPYSAKVSVDGLGDLS